MTRLMRSRDNGVDRSIASADDDDDIIMCRRRVCVCVCVCGDQRQSYCIVTVLLAKT